MMSRIATVSRATKETEVQVDLELDGSGTSSSDTGLPFFDHMLEQLGKHAGWDLSVSCKGDLDVDGLLKGLYKYSPAQNEGARLTLLASGTGMQWALKAQKLLAEEWDVAADVWSATSWTALRRETELGRFAEWTDRERIVGNLHRAMAELDGTPPGGPIDVVTVLRDMVAYNGGRPLTCLA